ncbi:uncharacterized protein [Centruroides vittatus]|uniref:uncharacterized protein n=1 Tax=Centruroides vittatus TaxID=120091 RepID=UPI0035101467
MAVKNNTKIPEYEPEHKYNDLNFWQDKKIPEFKIKNEVNGRGDNDPYNYKIQSKIHDEHTKTSQARKTNKGNSRVYKKELKMAAGQQYQRCPPVRKNATTNVIFVTHEKNSVPLINPRRLYFYSSIYIWRACEPFINQMKKKLWHVNRSFCLLGRRFISVMAR